MDLYLGFWTPGPRGPSSAIYLGPRPKSRGEKKRERERDRDRETERQRVRDTERDKERQRERKEHFNNDKFKNEPFPKNGKSKNEKAFKT